MKKIIAVAAALALACALTGCVTQVTKESKPSLSVSDTASQSASAASQSASASSQGSSSASQSASTNWTAATSATEAAQGAGIDAFAVPDRTVIADFVFTSPAYSYTDHVAQATYEVAGSAKLIVRKADGPHTASITDRDPKSFAQSWNNTYEGFEVTSHGNEQGKAVVSVWNDGTKEYGATIEGLGAATVTMDSVDIDDIVKAVKVAENAQAAPAQQADTASTNAGSNNAPGFNVKDAVFNNGLGEFLRYYYVQGSDGTGYWAVVTRGADGGEYTSYFNQQGTVVQGGVSGGVQHSYDGADFDVAGLVQQNGLGQFKRYFWVQGANGQGYWGIVSIGADGAEHTTYTDEKGNIIQGGVDSAQTSEPSTSNNGADFDVAALAQQNGLGQFEHYYWIQGSDGAGYWGIVTRGADGAEHTTYTDEKGNIIQGGVDAAATQK